MKTSLKKILGDKSQIVSIAEKMGLCNLQFVKTNCDNAFRLRASLDSKNPFANVTQARICETYLSIQLDCKVLIDVLTESYKQRLAKRPLVPSSLDRVRRRDQECVIALAELDENKVREIYGRSSDRIHFYADDIPDEEKFLKEHDRAQILSVAEDIMRKWDERQAPDVGQSEHVAEAPPEPGIDIPEIDEVALKQALRQLLASYGIKEQSPSVSMWKQPKILPKEGILQFVGFCLEVAAEKYDQSDRLLDDFIAQKKPRVEEGQTL